MKTFRMILGLLTLMLVVIAAPAAMADAPVEGRIGRTEVRFMEGMIDHHQMAIDMALDCLAREDVSDTVRTECQAVIDSQQPEIEQMQAWLLTWYNVDYSPHAMADMMEMMGGEGMEMPMEGMPATDPAMMMGMFAGFNRLEGDDYEAAWLEAMIDHHDDAIHMSNRLLERDADSAGHVELREIAQAIIDAQTEEIAHYEEMLVTMSAG
jgi:uncharacterized protein (DUF305 family)